MSKFQELIPITTQTVNNVDTLTCDARALHEFLESKQQFADWIKNRIEKYGFTEDVDFIVFHNSMKNPGDGRPRIEYALTIDMGKQLAMVENNDKGMQVRRYFLKCEQIAKEATARAIPKPARSQEELNARDAARGLRMLARMKEVYPAEMCAVFAAKSVVVVTGEPIQPLLPPVMNNQENWLSATQIANHFGITPQKAGVMLKKLGLHGEADSGHKYSQAKWDKSPYSSKQVISYTYDPDIVLPKIAAELEATSRKELN